MPLQIIEKDLEKIIEIRHDLHRHPELSNKEFRTTEKIKEFLQGLDNIEILKLPVETGLVAKIKSGRNGKVIGLRADIDAIAQREEADVEYKSQVPGLMHACGHDFHTASLLGVAKLLSENVNELKGDVVLLFQKAEETTKGAKEMIEAGLFNLVKPDMFFSLHNWPELPWGKVILKNGPLMAAKVNFEIEIKGKGAHGSMPHLNIDPIVCSASMIMSLQTVLSRNINPLDALVFSINSIKGGSEDNLVVDKTKMTATIRSLSGPAMIRAKERMEKIVYDTASAYECQATIKYVDNIPLTYNSEKMYKLAYKAAKEVVGEENIVDSNPTLASEDFSFIMEKVPSFFYWFGSGEYGKENYALHNSKFKASDQGLKTAIEVLTNSVFVAQN